MIQFTRVLIAKSSSVQMSMTVSTLLYSFCALKNCLPFIPPTVQTALMRASQSPLSQTSGHVAFSIASPVPKRWSIGRRAISGGRRISSRRFKAKSPYYATRVWISISCDPREKMETNRSREGRGRKIGWGIGGGEGKRKMERGWERDELRKANLRGWRNPSQDT